MTPSPHRVSPRDPTLDRRHGTGGGVLRLAAGLFLLPVRTFAAGMEVMVGALAGLQKLTLSGDRSLGAGDRNHSSTWDPRPIPPPPMLLPGGGGSAPVLPPLPTTTDIARDDVTEEPDKEERRMYVDQDLSGDMVKVVQYCIVSVLTDADGNAPVFSDRYASTQEDSSSSDQPRPWPPLIGTPQVIAFSNDMTPEDFTAWIIGQHSEEIERYKRHHHHHSHPGPSWWNRKYLRVAFSVISRFAQADVDWEELQARATWRIAEHTRPPIRVEKVKDPEAQATPKK